MIVNGMNPGHMVEGQQKTLEEQTSSPTTCTSATLEQHCDEYWTEGGLEWKTVAKDRPNFDAGLREFIKIHEAQSRKIKDDDDAT